MTELGNFPAMTFTSNKLKFDGENLVVVDGTLTLKGISKPVTLTVTSFQCCHTLCLKETLAELTPPRPSNVLNSIWANIRRRLVMMSPLIFQSKPSKNNDLNRKQSPY